MLALLVALLTTPIHYNANPTYCLDLPSGQATNGQKLQLWPCNGAAAQDWTVDQSQSGTIRYAANPTFCVDLPAANAINGASLQLYQCNGSAAQNWSFNPTDTSPTVIHYTANAGFCVDVPNGNAQNGTKVQLWQCNGADAQSFTVCHNGTAAKTPVQAASGSALVDSATPQKDGYHILFSDEFNGTTLDPMRWNLAWDGSGCGNNELEYYIPYPDNHFVSGSNLTLRVIKKDFQGKPYTSAKATTLGTADFTYGWVEARIKVPSGQGFWPAFWMLPATNWYGNWPTSGELDIMEILGGSANKLYGTAHFGPAWPNQKQQGGTATAASGTDFGQDFHVYAIDWQPDHATWYLDGNAYFTLKNTDGDWQTGSQGAQASTAAGGWPFNIPYYIILNVAMGGQWPGNPDGSITQGDMLVDYVRVYQKN